MLNGVGKVHCVFTRHGSFHKCHGKPQSSSWHISCIIPSNCYMIGNHDDLILFICSIIPSCKVPKKPKAGSKLPKKGKVLSEPVVLRSFGTIRTGLRFAQYFQSKPVVPGCARLFRGNLQSQYKLFKPSWLWSFGLGSLSLSKHPIQEL